MQRALYDYLHSAGTLAQVQSAQDFDALCDAVRQDNAGRLRWQTLRALGLPPWTAAPKRGDYLYALAQLRIDREEALASLCPTCRANTEGERCICCGALLPTQNLAFDEARYKELKQHGSSAI